VMGCLCFFGQQFDSMAEQSPMVSFAICFGTY
jgi:hypothetical protein